jgi:site-specific DNA-methyltransferase (cytosine-N4-specific)
MTPAYEDAHRQLWQGDAATVLRLLPEGAAHCCVSSPPYWQKIDYGHCEQIGQEAAPEAFVARLVEVFREVRRILVPGGSLWLNLGDSYASGGRGGGAAAGARSGQRTVAARRGWRKEPPGFKDKDLTLTPFRVADAIRTDGWTLRQVIIWAKPNAVEAARADRPAVSHEYVFLFSSTPECVARDPGEPWWRSTVWEIPAARPVPGFPVPMPLELARRCIVAGSRPGDVVLDPFNGSGTTGLAAVDHGRRYWGVEVNPGYADVSRRRWSEQQPCLLATT